MPTLECPSCGLKAPSEKNFCKNCGTRLIDPAECIRRASAAVEGKRYDEAIETLRQIPDSSAYSRKRNLHLFEVLVAADRLTDAEHYIGWLAEIQGSLDEEETNRLSSSLQRLALRLIDTHEHGHAIQALKLAKRLGVQAQLPAIEQHYRQAHVAQFQYYLSGGLLREAETSLDGIAKIEGGNEPAGDLAELLSELGKAFIHKSNHPDALRCFRRAHQMVPDNDQYKELMTAAQHTIDGVRSRRRRRLTLVSSVVLIVVILGAFLYYRFSGWIEVHVNRSADITVFSGDEGAGDQNIVAHGAGVTSLKSGRLLSRQYTVVVERDRYKRALRTVDVGSYRTEVVEVDLELSEAEQARLDSLRAVAKEKERKEREAALAAQRAEAEKERARQEAEKQAALEEERQRAMREEQAKLRAEQRAAEIARVKSGETLVANITSRAEITASSQYSAQYAPSKVGDGVVGTQDRGEWATRGQKAGAWLRMEWPVECMIERIVINDRNNPYDHTQEVLLKFSDGSSVRVDKIPNSGESRVVVLDDWKLTTSLLISISRAKAANVGLSEVAVYGTMLSR